MSYSSLISLWTNVLGFELPLSTQGSTPTTAHYHVAPFVFDELHGLLKQWPNSYAPNGHAIVAGTVAPFTQLFHGKHSPGLPDSLQFFAFDA